MTKLLLSRTEIRERARKITYNSSVKIEATQRNRDKNVRKNSGTANTLTRLGLISIDGNKWGVYPYMFQCRIT